MLQLNEQKECNEGENDKKQNFVTAFEEYFIHPFVFSVGPRNANNKCDGKEECEPLLARGKKQY